METIVAALRRGCAALARPWAADHVVRRSTETPWPDVRAMHLRSYPSALHAFEGIDPPQIEIDVAPALHTVSTLLTQRPGDRLRSWSNASAGLRFRCELPLSAPASNAARPQSAASEDAP